MPQYIYCLVFPHFQTYKLVNNIKNLIYTCTFKTINPTRVTFQVHQLSSLCLKQLDYGHCTLQEVSHDKIHVGH